MNIFKRILPSSDLEFAQEISNKIATHYPAKIEAKLKLEGGKKRLGGVLEAVFNDVEEYQSKARMGLIRKARFGNELKWRLKEFGYSDEFVDAITEGIVTHLTMMGRVAAKSK